MNIISLHDVAEITSEIVRHKKFAVRHFCITTKGQVFQVSIFAETEKELEIKQLPKRFAKDR